MDLLTVVGCVFLGLLAWCGLAAVVGLVLGPVCGAHDSLAPLLTDDEVEPSFSDADLEDFRASLSGP